MLGGSRVLLVLEIHPIDEVDSRFHFRDELDGLPHDSGIRSKLWGNF
jgi:hypothetical protein